METSEKKTALAMLRRRLQTEFETYRKQLLKQPKNEILNLAPDYLVRNTIVKAAKRYEEFEASGRHYLFNDQIETLLKSETPLEDICGEFFVNSDGCRLVFNDSIETHSRAALTMYRGVNFYPQKRKSRKRKVNCERHGNK